MPKKYSEIERENIRAALRREASKCLSKYGVKRTTVDELVKGASIAKGTFYLFYDSKESLFLDLIECFSSESERMYLEMLQELDENHIVTSLTDVFMAILMKFHRDGIYRFLSDNQLELVLRKSKRVGEKDSLILKIDALKSLFSYFYIDNEDDIESFRSAFRAILYILLHSEEIDGMEKALRFIIRGLVLQMVE